ncbi:hypothetical protein KKD19_01950 [Patescibacteria group bacterium]|nr:hypothetical protein [Patescibacteria group bacterium]MBU4511989.1 hypothetical protein [Patescibacteria group bacterium]MCG2693341.1 hypothetical protein [Candidatus Parcubacteria bacterium]
MNLVWLNWLKEFFSKNAVVIFSEEDAEQLKDVMATFGVLDHVEAGGNQAVAKVFKEFIFGFHDTRVLLELGRVHRCQMACAGDET